MMLVNCGSDTKQAPNPVVPPQTNSFAFIQEIPGQGYLFTPMLGTFTISGTNVQFSATAIKDPGTGQVVSAEFGSLILSNDGSKAAFEVYGGMGDVSNNQWDVFVANSNGTGLVQVTNDSYADELPQFSPNGSKVIFVSFRPGPNEYEQGQIVARNVDGSGEQVLPMPAGAEETWTPTYSPDGSKIAFSAWGYDGNDNEFAGIFVMNADGTNPHMLTNPMSPECYCWDEAPSYTSDGSKIVFAREDETSQTTEDVYIMNSDGSNVTKLTDGVGINSDPLVLKLTGTGDKILISSNRANPSSYNDFDIYSMNTDGTGLARLTNNSIFDGFCQEWFEWGDIAARHRQPMQRHVPHYLYQKHYPGHVPLRW